MWDFKLIKQAKGKNTKKYKNKLSVKDTSVGLRHLAPFTLDSAQLEALRGGNVEDQVRANWDGLKLNLGTLGGLLGGAVAGGAAGFGIGDAVGDKEGRLPGTILGAAAGILGGGWLGNYLTFKTMANNRGVDSSYGLRHLTPLGMPALVAALQGYDEDALVESNMNNLLLIGGGLAGNALGASAGPVGSIAGGIAGNLGAYSLLKNQRLLDYEADGDKD